MMEDDKDRIIDSPDGKRAGDDAASPLDGSNESGGTAGTGGINKTQDEASSGQNGG